jgi:predicted RecB family nuclease
MRTAGPPLELSASDLSYFLACRHRTALDLAVAQGIRKPPTWVDSALALLQQRGLDHERLYVEQLLESGLKAFDITPHGGERAVSKSLDAMRSGSDLIIQPALRDGRWFGRPDLLRRVERASRFGAWSYEVWDTKLTKDTRGGTILQLALYSDLLKTVQGIEAEKFHVVTPDLLAPVQHFRVQDYAAYFRLIRRGLEETALRDWSAIAEANYPEPVEHCDVCRWWSSCDRRRRDDDHLSLVAGISRLQTRELQKAGVGTLAGLGGLPLPLPFKPRRGAAETYGRVREQARVQLRGRNEGRPVHELLALTPDQGLSRLPEPSAGDVFLDLEGDPFVRDGGREYLFGLITTPSPAAPPLLEKEGRGKPSPATTPLVGEGRTTPSPGATPLLEKEGRTTAYRAWWAWSDAEERTAFEAVIDRIMAAWSSDPGMHVYHYAPYEPAALKRLMGRYATREVEVDRLLRAKRFVDLHAVVKHALRASVEKYSIKDLEPFYGFAREVSLADARVNLRVVERALELAAPDALTPEVRAAVEGYNRDDCRSACALRDWLERLRTEVEQRDGTPVPRPPLQEGEAPEHIDEQVRTVEALRQILVAGLPVARNERDDEQQARWLLAYMLDWHRREMKAPAWESFRLRDLTDAELMDERAGIAGLSFVERVPGQGKTPTDRYRFPPQDTDVDEGDTLHLPDPEGTTVGTVAAIDRGAGTVDIKKTGAQAGVHPSAVYAHSMVKTQVIADALFRIGEDVARHGMTDGTQYQAGRELLLSRPPRLRSGAFRIRAGETAADFATRIGPELDRTVLAIQGPPGAGKTFTGARMICELVRCGLKVGVTAVSHKVIRNLLDKVLEEAGRTGCPVRCAQKVDERSGAQRAIEETKRPREVLDRLRSGRANVGAGTAWEWAHEDYHGAVDVLFVDEAGQMSLANVLAVSQAAASVVLLGDPQQLEQPQQGSHPEGTDVSALDHILQGHQTIPPDRGIFLPETWRLAPRICDFTSEVFYEGRLESRAGLEKQALMGAPPFEGAGLWTVHVAHEGNQNSSIEEVDTVERIVAALLSAGSSWIDSEGVVKPMTKEDILIVAPYNAHVALLEERLVARGIHVGTVDRFQGQQAPVVIYSMATSTPEDAPRGMEFLYSLNRLNVATSRAQCACILVASPRLFEPECKSPRQMQLANALCRYAEMARVVEPAG